MGEVLSYLSTLPLTTTWFIFLLENMAITAGVLLAGRLFYKGGYTPRDWWICAITNVLNTVITYAGFWLWQHHIIVVEAALSWRIPVDFVVLFLGMDLLMFLFHLFIHKTFLFKAVHQLHHESIDPKPIDLFVLHPVETIGFGSLWLLLLMVFPFNIYAIMVYLVVNVVFGLAGHLGVEPLPARIMQLPVIRYLGTSTFHHDHHRDVTHNFGFYTSIWDRLLGTYSRRSSSHTSKV